MNHTICYPNLVILMNINPKDILSLGAVSFLCAQVFPLYVRIPDSLLVSTAQIPKIGSKV